jgi:hypothetical protein
MLGMSGNALTIGNVPAAGAIPQKAAKKRAPQPRRLVKHHSNHQRHAEHDACPIQIAPYVHSDIPANMLSIAVRVRYHGKH